MTSHRTFPLALLAIAIAGCGSSGDIDYENARLEGAVSIDGKPVEAGQIQFIPMDDGAGPAVAAPIKDGHYIAESVPLGHVVVRFAISETHGMVPTSSAPTKEGLSVINLVPPHYRNGWEIDVTDDNNAQDFAMKSS